MNALHADPSSSTGPEPSLRPTRDAPAATPGGDAPVMARGVAWIGVSDGEAGGAGAGAGGGLRLMGYLHGPGILEGLRRSRAARRGTCRRASVG